MFKRLWRKIKGSHDEFVVYHMMKLGYKPKHIDFNKLAFAKLHFYSIRLAFIYFFLSVLELKNVDCVTLILNFILYVGVIWDLFTNGIELNKKHVQLRQDANKKKRSLSNIIYERNGYYERLLFWVKFVLLVILIAFVQQCLFNCNNCMFKAVNLAILFTCFVEQYINQMVQALEATME